MSEKKRHLNALKTGQKLHWYEIRDILGQGGFGITYLAQDLNLAHEVAIKEYLPVDLAIRTKSGTVSPVSDEHHERYYWGLERFLDEARTLGQFKHPNIVQVIDLAESNGRHFMVLEFVEGETLKERIKRKLRRDVSPRHVPDEIVEITAVPYTLSGKKMEVPVRRILLGHDVEKAVNVGAMRNPDAMQFFINYAAALNTPLR